MEVERFIIFIFSLIGLRSISLEIQQQDHKEIYIRNLSYIYIRIKLNRNFMH